MFTFDVMFAFLGICCIAVVFFGNFSLVVHQTKGNYDNFILQKKLFDASEFLIQNDGEHHVISLERIRNEKDKLLLDDYDFQIKVEKMDGRIMLDEGPSVDGVAVRRAVLCGDGFEREVCILEIKAKQK